MNKSKFISRYFLFLIFFIFSTSFTPQDFSKFTFGIAIQTSVTNDLIAYYQIILDEDGNPSKKIFMTEEDFVMNVKGKVKNNYNPKGEDLFMKHGVDCGIMLEYRGVDEDNNDIIDTSYDNIPYCLPTYDLWKLKYGIHPKYRGEITEVPWADAGWAAHRYRPSHAQTVFLQQYNINNIHDVFYDQYMFNLLKDMQDTSWIRLYKEIQ